MNFKKSKFLFVVPLFLTSVVAMQDNKQVVNKIVIAQSDDDKKETCSVCLEEAKNNELRSCLAANPCKYKFCLDCMYKIIKQCNGKCPCCRQAWSQDGCNLVRNLVKNNEQPDNKNEQQNNNEFLYRFNFLRCRNGEW